MPIKHVSLRERSRIVRWWRLFRTRRPTTFTEKVRYKMLRDHRPLLITLSDKAAARDYIASIVGEGYLPALIASVEVPAQLDDMHLPDSYAIKPTHGSGAGVLVSPTAPADARLPAPGSGWVLRHVRPEAVDRQRLAQLCAEWLEQIYGQGPNNEWAYGQVPRRVIVEELLTGPDGAVPADYKLFVFHQRCRFVQVDGGRFGGHTQDFYTPAWQRLPMSGGLPWAATPPPRPDRLEEMISIAERLGGDTDFVRVDLYVLPERVIVGELTNYPAGGHSPFYPESFNEEFGRHWVVPRRYR